MVRNSGRIPPPDPRSMSGPAFRNIGGCCSLAVDCCTRVRHMSFVLFEPRPDSKALPLSHQRLIIGLVYVSSTEGETRIAECWLFESFAFNVDLHRDSCGWRCHGTFLLRLLRVQQAPGFGNVVGVPNSSLLSTPPVGLRTISTYVFYTGALRQPRGHCGPCAQRVLAAVNNRDHERSPKANRSGGHRWGLALNMSRRPTKSNSSPHTGCEASKIVRYDVRRRTI